MRRPATLTRVVYTNLLTTAPVASSSAAPREGVKEHPCRSPSLLEYYEFSGEVEIESDDMALFGANVVWPDREGTGTEILVLVNHDGDPVAVVYPPSSDH